MRKLVMKCRECGRFISIKDAENSVGRIGDAFRNKGVCEICQNKAVAKRLTAIYAKDGCECG